MNKQLLRLGLVAAVPALSFYADTALGDSVVLWNKLGSSSEVTKSETGPNGSIQQGAPSIDYVPTHFANGVRVNGDGNDSNPSAVTFDVGSIASYTGNRGTMAFWVKPDHDSNYQGIARWINFTGYPPGRFGPGIYWRGWDQVIRFEILSEPSSRYAAIDVPNFQFSFRAGEVFHIALVWDREGIDGTRDNIRAYINGTLYGSIANVWDSDLEVAQVLMGRSDYAQLATIDNLVAYDYAKTDFSDRFNENPIGKTFSSFNPRAELTLGPKANDDSYWVRGWIKLADTSDGINPLTDPVTIQVGSFAHTVQAGSFVQDGNAFKFVGPVGASTLDVKFWPLSPTGTYWFKSCLKNGNLADTTLQPKIQLTIGDDQGSATLDIGYAKFGKGKNGQNWVFPPAK